jgi:hypothetical protein
VAFVSDLDLSRTPDSSRNVGAKLFLAGTGRAQNTLAVEKKARPAMTVLRLGGGTTMAEIEIHNKEKTLGTQTNADGSPVAEVNNEGKIVAEIRNKEGIFGTKKNQDGTPVKEVVFEGEVIAEIHNKEGLFGNETNKDGSPVQEIVKKN